MTVKDEDTELPRESEAVHTTVLVPTGNELPDALTHDTATAPSTMSEADGMVNDTTAPAEDVASTHGMLAGVPVITGAVLSQTCITEQGD